MPRSNTCQARPQAQHLSTVRGLGLRRTAPKPRCARHEAAAPDHFAVRAQHPHRPHLASAAQARGGDNGGAAAPGEPPYGSFDCEPVAAAAAARERELVAEAVAAVRAQQRAGLPPPYDPSETRKIVEAAMLAAVTGLAYTLATLLKLEGYLSYVLPMPVVVAALRSGPSAAVKTCATAFLLLFILMGPVRAVTYLLIYGLLSLSIGCGWAYRLPWGATVPLAAAVRIGGYMLYIQLSSWVTNENLLALMITNVHSLLDQLSAVLGTSGAPSPTAVVVTICSLLFVNSLLYVSLMHVLYSILLRGMGLRVDRMPGFVTRMLPAASGAGMA